MYGVSDGRQTEIRVTAEQLLPVVAELIFEVEIAVKKFKMYKSEGIYHIPAELIQAGDKIFCSEVQNILIIFEIRKTCHSN